MKKITLTRKFATLQLSVNELIAMKNALIEVCHRLGSYEFETRVNISEIEAIALANKLRQIIEKPQSEETEIQLTYREILALQGSLDEVCNSPHNLLVKIGLTKEQLLPLVEFISVEVVDKMEEGTMLGLISKKIEQIVQKLNLNFSQVKSPRTQPHLTQECYLKVGSRLFMFLLSSLENAETWSNIQILEIDSQENKQVLAKSVLHKIDPWHLSRIIAYLEVCQDLINQTIQPEIFILSPLSDKNHNICRFQVVSGKIDSKEQGFLELRFSLNAQDIKDNFSSYREAVGLTSFAEIEEFTTSICKYLVGFYGE
ncbi:MAG TPA: hypothetical protein DEG47_20410 [Cyanobacteria bacterium UBA11148]|nr:hypothetical protein [Cyanobacteria bacterium UBA11148]